METCSPEDGDLNHVPGLHEADETGNCFGPGILVL